LRGAHFMSHTFWTGWLCWTIAWLVDTAVRRRHRKAAVSGAIETPLEKAN
jgi:membrane-associated PAP2 superfamily phosphatase